MCVYIYIYIYKSCVYIYIYIYVCIYIYIYMIMYVLLQPIRILDANPWMHQLRDVDFFTKSDPLSFPWSWKNRVREAAKNMGKPWENMGKP